MKTKILFTAAIVFCIGIASVQAQVRERAYDQHERIMNGSRNGELTKKEQRRLAKEQKHIRKEIKRAKRDGHLSRAERRRIWHDQNYANRKIYRYKHNHASRF